MASSPPHEPLESLSPETRDMHRALTSLIEELEAVDWYAQRVEGTHDEELARVLAHNRDEEKEHACMTLEWIRRHDAGFDEQLRKFLFQTDSIVAGERGDEAGSPARHSTTLGTTLGIGSLRTQEEHA